MRFFENLDERVKNLGFFDLKMLQFAGGCFFLIIAKLFPEIMATNIWWFVIVGILVAIKPFYSFWKKID